MCIVACVQKKVRSNHFQSPVSVVLPFKVFNQIYQISFKRLKAIFGRMRDKIPPSVILLAAEPLSVFVILRCLEPPWYGLEAPLVWLSIW